jgi:sulfoxide reductase heme-binding subunit YedZ
MVLRKWRRVHWLQAATHIAALLPLALLIYDFTQGRLSANPIREITLRTGKTALVTLVLSLACTPIDILFGFKTIMRLRKSLGLYAALYAGLHLAIYVGLDYGFAWPAILEDLRYRRFIQFGLLAFLLLIPLAITSTRGWMRRLGKSWKRLHRLVYLAAPLAVFHFYLLVKANRREPLLYGLLVLALLAFRIPVVRRSIMTIRNKVAAKRD